MTLTNETIKFDAETSGIVVQITNADGKRKKFIMSTLGEKLKPRLFNNLEIAKLMANANFEEGLFKYWIMFNDDEENMVPIDKCRYIKNSHTFQYIDSGANCIYNFVENRKHKLSNLGYLVFDNGDVAKNDKETGLIRQKELNSYVIDVVNGLLGEKNKWGDFGITLIETPHKEIVLHIKNTTTKIHIASNSKIMDINQEKGLIPGTKRIPFKKNMDKYLTFYVFASKDVQEAKRLEGEVKARTIIGSILKDLQDYYPDSLPKFEEIQFIGFLDLED